jgi:hypothetical protein
LTINDNTEYHKYYRIYNPNGYNWTSSVGTSHPPTSITITATQKDVTIVEGTESDYDFYKDTYTYSLIKQNNTYKAIKSYEKGQYYGN